ncbi:MAG TPA: RNA-binding S4 domain-containing protein [Casimicrobiaceae bacterium]
MITRADAHAKSLGAAPNPSRQRLDKWLWAARFYKTRSLAAQAIDAGHVRAGGVRVKPAHLVRVSERISVRKSSFTWEIEVAALSDRRGGAADAALLYRETAQSIQAREEALAQRKAALSAETHFSGRPTKRDRRKLEDFLNEP